MATSTTNYSRQLSTTKAAPSFNDLIDSVINDSKLKAIQKNLEGLRTVALYQMGLLRLAEGRYQGQARLILLIMEYFF